MTSPLITAAPRFGPKRMPGDAEIPVTWDKQVQAAVDCYNGGATGLAMKNGLYSITTKGFDRVEWPPGGVFFLRNGVLLGGSSFMYYIGSYSAENGIFRGECVLNPHTPPPASHLYFNAKDIGAGLTGTYEGDQAELTATVLLGKRSLTLQLTLRKLADI